MHISIYIYGGTAMGSTMCTYVTRPATFTPARPDACTCVHSLRFGVWDVGLGFGVGVLGFEFGFWGLGFGVGGWGFGF